MGRACGTYGCLQGFGGTIEGKGPLGNPGVDGEVGGGGRGVDPREYGNELSGSAKCGGFLDKLRTC